VDGGGEKKPSMKTAPSMANTADPLGSNPVFFRKKERHAKNGGSPQEIVETKQKRVALTFRADEKGHKPGTTRKDTKTRGN